MKPYSYPNSFPSADGAGRRCCYDSYGNILPRMMGGNLIYKTHPRAGIPVIAHYLHDVAPYMDCCVLTKTCEEFYAKRFFNSTSKYQPGTGK